MNRRWWAAVAACGLAGLVTACTTAPQVVAKPPVPTFSVTATATSIAPVPTAPPKACTDVAAAADVDQIVGHQLTGAMGQVVGIPQPGINRTARLDCYYGVPDGQPVTAGVLSIGIASYTDAQSAQHRVTLTVTSARDAGATTSDVRVGAAPATLVASAQSQELVLADGDLTVLVIANNGVLTPGHIGPQLVELAQRALSAQS